MRTLLFLLIYPALGLVQLWYLMLRGYVTSSSVDFKIIAGTGALLFFATGLYAGALDSLIQKGWFTRSRFLQVTGIGIGFGTLFLVIGLYASIIDHEQLGTSIESSAEPVQEGLAGLGGQPNVVQALASQPKGGGAGRVAVQPRKLEQKRVLKLSVLLVLVNLLFAFCVSHLEVDNPYRRPYTL